MGEQKRHERLEAPKKERRKQKNKLRRESYSWQLFMAKDGPYSAKKPKLMERQ